MRELNKNYVYDLSELTSEELKEVWMYLTKTDDDWGDCKYEEMISYQKTDMLSFNKYNWEWDNTIKSEEATNAKELFYTLENIQVDCRDLTEEQIKEMADIFERAGYNPFHINEKSNLEVKKPYLFLKPLGCNKFIVGVENKNKTTITYDKFMELFGDKLPPYKKASLKWSYSTLLGGAIETKEHHSKELTKEILQAMETLKQQLQKAEAEVKRLKEAIEESKIKIGDWCTFWNHDKSKSIIAKFQGSKFACITSGDYFLNCEKITDPVLLESLNRLF